MYVCIGGRAAVDAPVCDIVDGFHRHAGRKVPGAILYASRQGWIRKCKIFGCVEQRLLLEPSSRVVRLNGLEFLVSPRSPLISVALREDHGSPLKVIAVEGVEVERDEGLRKFVQAVGAAGWLPGCE